MNNETLINANYCIRSNEFEIYSTEQYKCSLSSFDDKRYLIDNIKTIPYGYNYYKYHPNEYIIDTVSNQYNSSINII